MSQPLTLYYSPGACSLVSHIALEETGAEFEAARVVLAEGQHLRPEYLAINPHARVPALATRRGVITESLAINGFLALEFGKDGTIPLDDTFLAGRSWELLSWCASTVHIGFAQVWRAERFTGDASLHPAIQQGGREALERFFGEIEELAGNGWTVGDRFTAVDSYFATFFRWGRRIGFDMSGFRRWAALVERVLERPAVQRAIAREGLLPADFLPALEAA